MVYTIDSFKSDLPRDLTYGAHQGTSFSPEERSKGEVAIYCKTMLSYYNDIVEMAEDGITEEEIVSQFERFRKGYIKSYCNYLRSRSRIVSPMIAGPANFPVHKMEKLNEQSHNTWKRHELFIERAMNAMRRILRPSERPIMSGDDNAVERLEKKVKELSDAQDHMKLVNRTWKKYLKSNNRKCLYDIGLSDDAIDKLEKSIERCWHHAPYPPFTLTNNNNRLKTAKKRLTRVQRMKDKEDLEYRSGDIDVKIAFADNRVRLFFPGKPDADIRKVLKSNGFRWAGSLGCWQAYINSRSRDFVKSHYPKSTQSISDKVVLVHVSS